jgi:Cu-Zn family superoxide dismutase
MRTPIRAAILLTALDIPVGGIALAQSREPGAAHAAVADAAGTDVGNVGWTQNGTSVTVDVSVHGLPPGFHGFHIHAVGDCVAPFTSAGAHLNPKAATHPDHAADQPVLLVNADGSGSATFVTDRYAVADIVGAAVIVHASPDNYANIPDRYQAPAPSASPVAGAPPSGPTASEPGAPPVMVSGPDPVTLATGDAGARIACGVIESGPAAQ